MNIVVPDLGESVVEATISRWLKKVGDAVTIGEPVVVLATDKVDLEIGAQTAGTLATIIRQDGEDVKIGEVLGDITAGSVGTSAAPPAPAIEQTPASPTLPNAATAPETQSTTPVAQATPVAQRMADAEHVDLTQVPPSGARVTKSDVQKFVEGRAAPAADVPAERPNSAPSAVTSPTPLAASAANNGRRDEVIRMSRRRRTIATRLVEAQHTAAMLTTFNEIDMSAVQALRERRKEVFKQKFGVGLGLSSFFVKASIGALKAFPRLNAELRGDDMILKHYYDIGVAIGAEEGLVVPVLRDADRLSFAEIEKQIKAYAAQVGDGSLALEALRGGTFTITNGGIFGSMMSTPILNAPQVGILGLHAIKPRAVVIDDQIVARPMMYVALSYDHRIVDGREAVQFLVRVKELVEDPESLLIEG
ncbi:MAG: 2-oxoglutarate dehydrogenase complex dihydrolipoyllysine-residue succinyltransferase [Chloroflexota bacterium]|nr:2-oxoglutarate dehydrogenase complex dihydrolipoyllysine-residue succinyltransferase [Chloroflexota bacterium]